MIGLLFSGLIGNVVRGPLAIIAIIAAVFAICGCAKCAHCRLRDCSCCKRFLRVTRMDDFDDFELVMLVHEALFERTGQKLETVVRVTAGPHSVETDAASNGIFQQPLNITVEQGTETILVELLDNRGRILATLSLDTSADVLGGTTRQEHVFNMKQKGKGIRNPRVKLTISVEQDADVESGLLQGVSSDVNKFVRLHHKGSATDISEMDVLTQACTGPLELFEGLGKTRNVFVGIIGPPIAKRFAFALWNDKFDQQNKRLPFLMLDLLRVESVQTDPTRHHVFVINYFDENRMAKAVTLRRIDRARDVWVEILRLLVQKVHDSHLEKKRLRQTHMGAAGSMGGMSMALAGANSMYGSASQSPSSFRR